MQDNLYKIVNLKSVLNSFTDEQLNFHGVVPNKFEIFVTSYILFRMQNDQHDEQNDQPS